MVQEKKHSVSYWAKELVECPVCKKKFRPEMMRQGGGRTIAGDLTDGLHSNYEVSKKFGKIYPLIYDIGACPYCETALFWRDFKEINDQNTFTRISQDRENRIKAVKNIFPHYNLENERTLYDAVAAYYLALHCYDKVNAAYAPTFKSGLICLRLAWLCKDLNEVYPDHNFLYISQVFYRKALFFYQQTLINEGNGTESIGTVVYFGPDTDKNYGYNGLVYLAALLEFKYGQTNNQQSRLKKLDEGKRSIAKIFGLGKSSKAKPGPLLEVARSVYDAISEEIASTDVLSDL